MITPALLIPQICSGSVDEEPNLRKNCRVVSRIIDAAMSSRVKKTIAKGEDGLKSNKSKRNKSEKGLMKSHGKMIDSSHKAGCPLKNVKDSKRKKSSLVDTMPHGSSSTVSSKSALINKAEKSVRFNKSCYIKKTISRNAYTLQEIKKCWFSDEEYREIHDECLEKIRKIDRGEEPSAIDKCRRGLDCRTQSAVTLRQQHRLDALLIVLDEQYIGSSPEIIAEQYSVISYRCQLWANGVGHRDKREAEAYY